jgi:hypothetical protein
MARPLVPEPRMALVSPVAAAMLADLNADLGACVVSCSNELRAAQALLEARASDLTPALRAIEDLTSWWRETA